MAGLPAFELPTLSSAALAALDIALKSTLLILIALVLNRLWSRPVYVLARATMWNALLIGLLVMPLITVAFPPLRVPCLSSAPGGATTDDARLVASADTETIDWAQTPATLRALSPRQRAILAGDAEFAWLPSATAQEDETAPPPLWQLDLGMFALAVYVGGVVFLMLRLLASLVAVGILRRAVVPLRDPFWTDAVDGWRRVLGIRRPVAVAEGSRLSVPITVGALRPTIIIPSAMVEAADGSDRDAVVLHELSHIRRGDYGWQLLSALVQALYWAHPLVWLTRRVIGVTREQACDQLCVHYLGGPGYYCRTLLDVVESLIRRHRAPAARGLTMARSSMIEQRLDWIERGHRRADCVPHWALRITVGLCVFIATGLLASIQLSYVAGVREAQASSRLQRWSRALAALNRAELTRELSSAELERLSRAGVPAQRVGADFLAALGRGDQRAIDALVVGRLAGYPPDAWESALSDVHDAYGSRLAQSDGEMSCLRAADHMVLRGGVLSNASGQPPHALALVLTMQDTGKWRVIALDEVSPDAELESVLHDGLEWAAGQAADGRILSVRTSIHIGT